MSITRFLERNFLEVSSFAPFHYNVNTPSAKRYGNGIKCFGQCQKYYTVYDLLKRFNPGRIDEIKNTVIIPESTVTRSSTIPIVSFDRSLSIVDIVKIIVNEN